MGIYDYVPTNTGAWGNRLGKGPSLHKGFLPDLKERLKPSVYGFKSPDVQNESSNGEKSDSNVSDISMEVVDSELQSPIRRPPWPLQRIGEEDEEAEAELENRVESKKTDMESLVTAQIPFQPSSVQTFDESSCVHMSSQLSTSEDDSGAVTVQPGLVSVKSTLFLGRTGGVDKENVCQQPPPPPLSPSSSTRHRRVSWAGPREALARLKKAETREMKVMEEAEADPISALVERSNVVVDGEKFIVLRQIARGGFSSVFCVMNKKREMLALKRVGLVSASADVLEVCRNEVDLLLSLRESGRVIALYNYELSPSHLVMVLELAEQDLKSHLKMRQESGSLPDHVVTFLWNEMLACVKVIHDRRIVHLDLKPENFVIVRGMLKLIDLGISQRLPVDCTHMDLHKPMGSIVYMSPEQLSCIVGGKFASSNDGIDAKVRLKTDVWALGVILYEMLHGRSPFGRTQQAAIMSAILSPTVSINFPHVDNAKLDEIYSHLLIPVICRPT
ncbi:dual specificity serine:threonine tyrosine [Echinococcus multilocularis]|uniref:Dual specificity serine:threonine tyrosine n=1 Tax=Echinococcus multilocularis TaxID=6211 RepID=A0A0S4MLF2_ECHMU|nr:dual specificity serine:threonine tyrosine [Echinococcus multilocularis]